MSYVIALEHSGIKGMRWGIRRWQNPDGTLTEAGKLRYGQTDDGSRNLTLDRGRELRATGETKGKQIRKAIFRGAVIRSVFKKIENITLNNLMNEKGEIDKKYSWVSNAFKMGRTAASLINWNYSARNISAMNLSDEAGRYENSQHPAK